MPAARTSVSIDLSALIAGVLLCFALPRFARSLSPGSPARRKVSHLANAAIALERASETNKHRLLRIIRCAAEHLPVTVAIVRDEEHRVVFPHYSLRREANGVHRPLERPFTWGEVVFVISHE